MTVTGTQSPTFLPYDGQPDPRLPLGRWLFAHTLSGDGSGGRVIHNCEFTAAATPAGPAYSLIDLTGHKSDGLEETAVLVVSAFSPKPRLSGFIDREAALPVSQYGFGSGPHATGMALPLYLGVRDVLRAGGTLLAFHWQSNVDGVTYRVNLAGYYWAPETVDLPGGPQSPGNVTVPLAPRPGGSGFYDRLRAGNTGPMFE